MGAVLSVKGGFLVLHVLESRTRPDFVSPCAVLFSASCTCIITRGCFVTAGRDLPKLDSPRRANHHLAVQKRRKHTQKCLEHFLNGDGLFVWM